MKEQVLNQNTRFYQWETEQRLIIEYGDCDEARFSHVSTGTPIPVPVQNVSGGKQAVDVPDIMLQVSGWVKIYLTKNSNTLTMYNVPVLAAKKPSDYVYTETEVLSLKSLEARVANLEKNGGAGGSLPGQRGEKGDKGDPGPKGDRGDPGKDGVTPEFSIGTVETLDPGSDAVVTLGGTAERPILNFGIPRGDNAVISPDQGGDVSPEGGGYLVQWNSIVGKPDYLTEAGINNLIDEKLDDSGGAAIIDVVELPTEDIREDCFYRLLTGSFFYKGTPQADWTCCIVDSLPEEGSPVTTDMVHVVLYYAVDTAAVSGYINSALSGAVGVPAGWYPVEVLAQAFNLGWGGIIWNEAEAPADEMNRLVLSYAVYQFKNDWYNLSDKVGWRGTGAGSEIFNSLVNIASGNSSHAEGYYSHAEGNASHAEGNYSHAEGGSSHAEGDSSHAEGYYSHAEGYSSHAEGDSSHAEGYYSHAVGRSQHVQGEFNIVDPERDPANIHIRAKYAHIVGNGDSESNRSNAHTLDWSGNAWFAGYVEGTAMILKSPGGKRFKVTVDDSGNLTATETTE